MHTRLMREFARFVSLNVAGMIGLSCYILADTFFVSLGMGADGLAALNLAIPVYSFIHGSGLMIGMGAGTMYTIHASRGRRAQANRVFTGAAGMAAVFAAAFVLAGLTLPGAIVAAFGGTGAVGQMSVTYLRVILLFAPAFLANNLLLCFVRNDGAPQRAMAAMIGGSLSNVVLDWVFIFPCGMGIFGAAFATGLAPLISMAILSPHFLRGRCGFRPARCKPGQCLLGQSLAAGLPSLVTEVSSGVVMIVFNSLMLSLEGSTGVAAYGVIANLSLVVLAIYTGIAQGVQPLLSRSQGQGRQAEARAMLGWALGAMVLFSAAVYLSVALFADPIAGVFNSGGSAALQSIAVQGLRLYFIGCPFAGFNVILAMYFTTSQRPRPAGAVSLLRGFVLIIPLALALAGLWGTAGVWCAFPAAEALTSIWAALAFCREKKREE